MNANAKLGAGGLLAMPGGIGVVLGPTIGASGLPRPFVFGAGFVVGIVAGLGVALAVAGLIERRHQT